MTDDPSGLVVDIVVVERPEQLPGAVPLHRPRLRDATVVGYGEASRGRTNDRMVVIPKGAKLGEG